MIFFHRWQKSATENHLVASRAIYWHDPQLRTILAGFALGTVDMLHEHNNQREDLTSFFRGIPDQLWERYSNDRWKRDIAEPVDDQNNDDFSAQDYDDWDDGLDAPNEDGPDDDYDALEVSIQSISIEEPEDSEYLPSP